jgi:hypothetical protein
LSLAKDAAFLVRRNRAGMLVCASWRTRKATATIDPLSFLAHPPQTCIHRQELDLMAGQTVPPPARMDPAVMLTQVQFGKGGG